MKWPNAAGMGGTDEVSITSLRCGLGLYVGHNDERPEFSNHTAIHLSPQAVRDLLLMLTNALSAQQEGRYEGADYNGTMSLEERARYRR